MSAGDRVELVDPDDESAKESLRESIGEVAARMRAAADNDDAPTALATLDEHQLLCAHREGRYGVSGWNRLVEQLVADRTGVTTYDE
jgi:exodeoxyribonuclease V alpha subunit